MKYLPSILAGTFIAIGAGVLVAHAVESSYVLLESLPIGAGGAPLETVTMSTYLSGMVKLLIALGAVFSVLVAIIGGTQYVASGIAPSAKQDAKERITNALIGLTLVLASYLILNSINPTLLSGGFTLPGVGTEIAAPAPTVCPIPPLTVLSGAALDMEGGTKVLWNNTTDANVQRNLFKLQTEVGKLQAELGNVGASATVNSAWRPKLYQQHLYEIFSWWITLDLKNDTRPECAALKTTVGGEYSTHGLGSAVSAPTNTAPHVRGVGVDIQLNGYADSAINAFMVSKNIDLEWQGIPGDEVHYNLKNPPYTGPAAN